MDTDAAGIYHWTAALRMAEAAEAALHTRLGIEKETFGVTPRVQVRFEFRRPVRFNDEVDVSLRVLRVGSSSLTQRFVLEHAGEVCAEGEMVICFLDASTGRAAPWPAHIRSCLEGAGPLKPTSDDA
jgi:acyl-CoA thioesterase FadM